MATNVQTPVKSDASLKSRGGFVYGPLILGWLVPGAGHLVQRRWIRGLLLFVSITAMFALGLKMQGQLYAFNTSDLLETLGFAGDLGAGLLYIGAFLLNLGQLPVQVATADYGTRFAVVAGLLNIMAAVDAHNIRTGRKP